MRKFAKHLGSAILFLWAMGGDAQAKPTRSKLERILIRKNPMLKLLLSKHSELTYQLGACDMYGETKGAECDREFASSKNPSKLFSSLKTSGPNEQLYCIDYSRPIFWNKRGEKGQRGKIPISGFRCLGSLFEADGTSIAEWELKFTCWNRFAPISSRSSHHSCSLELSSSNEDEGAIDTFSFNVVRDRGKNTIEESMVVVKISEYN